MLMLHAHWLLISMLLAADAQLRWAANFVSDLVDVNINIPAIILTISQILL